MGLSKRGVSTVQPGNWPDRRIPCRQISDAGSAVHAGSQNIASVVRVRVSKVGRDTRLAQLMRLIEARRAGQAADRAVRRQVGGWFIIAVSIAAAAVFAYWSRFSVVQAIDYSVALLIVTCPCVLGLATPLTLAIAIGPGLRGAISWSRAARHWNGSREAVHFCWTRPARLLKGNLRLIKWIGDTSVQPARR